MLICTDSKEVRLVVDKPHLNNVIPNSEFKAMRSIFYRHRFKQEC